MKRTLFLATTAALMLSGCTKQQVDVAPQNDGNIGFESILGKQTKGLAKDAFEMGDQFYVFGGKTGSVNFDVTNPSFTGWSFLDGTDLGVAVTNYGGGQWRYSNPVAWDNEKATFFAFSPAPETGAGAETYGITINQPADLTTIPSIDFEVKGGYATNITDLNDPLVIAARAITKQQVDLLSVFTPNQAKENLTVDLPFKHALSQLRFSAKANHGTGIIRVNSIVIKDVINKGVLTLANDDTNSKDLDYLGGWVPSADANDKRNFAINLRNDVASSIPVGTAIHALTDDDEALMMIPQSLAGMKLEVKYAYSSDGGTNWDNYEAGTAIEVELEKATSHWNPNKRYNYVLNITPGAVIGFTATIVPWDDETEAERNDISLTNMAGNAVEYDVKAGDVVAVTYVGNNNWLTYDGDGKTDEPISAGVEQTIAGDGKLQFKVLENTANTGRVAELIITRKDAATGNMLRVVSVKLSQSAGSGIIKATDVAGTIATLTLAAGDKIAIPQTKANADWVLVDGAKLDAEYTTAGPVEISVEANMGAARAATLIVTYGNIETTYTIEQDGVAATELEVVAAGAVAHTGVANDVVTLTKGGGSWLTITDDGVAAAELKTGVAVTATGAYTIEASENKTTSVRTAEFTIGTTAYELTQEAGAAAPIAVAVTAAADGSLTTDALTGYTISTIADGSWLKIDGVAIADGEVAGAGALTADVNTGAERIDTFTATSADGLTIKNYTVTQAAGVTPPTTTPVAVTAAADGSLTTDALAGYTISTIADGGWLKIDGAAIADGEVAGAGVLTADVNAGAERTATFTATSADGLTIKNYTVTQAAGVTPPTPSTENVAVTVDGTFTPEVTLAGEIVSDLTNCDWLLVDGISMVAGAVNGTITVDANTGVERIATFTATSADGLTIKNYTVTQAGV